MKQLLLGGTEGAPQIVTVPAPGIRPGHLLIRTEASLISLGTERSMVEQQSKSLFARARENPDKVLAVLKRARRDGVRATGRVVQEQLQRQRPLGYCNCGIVIGVGEDVEGVVPGQRVASNGPHAEYVSVPVNLCAVVDEAVGPDKAVFTVLSAVALQGIRLAKPTIGECVGVIGVGLVGVLAVKLLRAQGCRVLAVDPNSDRLAMAAQSGATTLLSSGDDDILPAVAAFSRGRGLDAVLICAATDDDEVMRQAARMCRMKARLVLVGTAGLNLDRAELFSKELSLQVSRSYGPGRYDPAYEEQGRDYPVGYVRWTEQRNFEAVLDLMSEGFFDPSPLITRRVPFSDAETAYSTATDNPNELGVVLEYDTGPAEMALTLPRQIVATRSARAIAGPVCVGFIGAGRHAQKVLLPAFQAAGANLTTIASVGGISATAAARKFGFSHATTNVQDVLGDDRTNTIVIATTHESHSPLVCEALALGKNVFVEKPLSISLSQLEDVVAAYARASQANPTPVLSIGFNRRFSPHVRRLKLLLAKIDAPKAIVITVNAGRLPDDHWILDEGIGGGRFVGEGCHFVDLALHLIGREVCRIGAMPLSETVKGISQGMTATLGFLDGSVATIHYLPNGHPDMPKERVEVYVSGRTAILDDFGSLKLIGWPREKNVTTRRRNKGNVECVVAFVRAVEKGEVGAVPFEEIISASRVTLDLVDAARALSNAAPK